MNVLTLSMVGAGCLSGLALYSPPGRRLRDLAGELGLVNAGLYCAQWALRRAPVTAELERYVLVAQPVDSARLPARRPGRGFEIRRLRRDDPDLSSIPRSAQDLRMRFDQGANCLGAFRGTELVGWLWLAPTPYRDYTLRCRYRLEPPGVAMWDLDIYVLPAHRGGPAFARLWAEAHRRLEARGVRWTVSAISAVNVESLRAHARLGLRRLGSMVVLRLGERQMSLFSLPPWLHLAGRRAPEVILRLDPGDG